MKKSERLRNKAEEWDEKGWEALGFPEPGVNADLPLSEACFIRALEADSDLADSYNGLGTLRYVQGRYAEAEAMYRAALEKARRELGSDAPDAFTWWGEHQTRPYMRARHGLALTLVKQGRVIEGIHELEELFLRNPNDNQGVRYLVGGLYHLKGSVKIAMSWYERAGGSVLVGCDPGTELNHGLALFQMKKYDEAVSKVRSAFFLNTYLPQEVLHEPLDHLEMSHRSNLEEPPYAADYVETYGRLWRPKKSALSFLARTYRNGIVQCDLRQFKQLRVRLRAETNFERRQTLLKEEDGLTSISRIRETSVTITRDVIAHPGLS